MTDKNPFRNAANDPDFRQRMAQDAQQASPKTIAQAGALSEAEMYKRTGNVHYLTGPDFFAKSMDDEIKTEIDQARIKISRAIAAYEETRMGQQPKPKFILEIKDNYFYAKPSRATLWDAVFVAIATATWLALIASIYLVFK